MLERLLPELESLEPWSAETVEGLFAAFCEREEFKLGEVAQPPLDPGLPHRILTGAASRGNRFGAGGLLFLLFRG